MDNDDLNLTINQRFLFHKMAKTVVFYFCGTEKVKFALGTISSHKKTSTFMISNEKRMKKAVTLMVLAAAIVLSSCSSYTCPTYSKALQKMDVNKAKI